MANIKSQKKRNRQNEKRRLKNVSIKSSLRTINKKVLAALDAKDGDTANAVEYYKQFVKMIDTAAGKGIIHKNTAARKKSRLAKRINAVQGGPL